MTVETGDVLIHPQHGAVEVKGTTTRKLDGEKITFVKLNTNQNLRVFVPTGELEDHGVRRPISTNDIDDVREVLADDVGELLGGQWRKRMRRANERLDTGDIEDVAAVVRDFGVKLEVKGLSSSERQMLNRARHSLESELAVRLGDDDAVAMIDDAIESHVDAGALVEAA